MKFDEVIANVDMFCTSVKFTSGMSKSYRGLIIRVQHDRVIEWPENFANHVTNPQQFFCRMDCCHVFSFHRQQRYELLLFRSPGYSPSIDKNNKPRNGSSMLLRCSICIRKSLQSSSVFISIY